MQRGFSLIEMLIVILIVIILSGAVLYNIPASLARFEVRGAAEALAADIRWLQQVSINSANTSEQITLIPELVMRQTPPYGYIIIRDSSVIRSYEFPLTVRSGLNERRLAFATNGRPADGAQLTFTLYSTKAQGVSAKVIVEMITGRVRIE